ncbi:MAG TPA: V-type ATP synthase subunit D [Spirochaetia bacterium]|nr:V-type ATP synthase subunit D [Spirochaetia bacterium]
MEQVNPTRTELLNRRAQIRLATQGAQLLRGKREALVREFLTQLGSFNHARDSMRKSLLRAKRALIRALSLDGPEAVASAGLAAGRGIVVGLEERNIWGVRVVDVTTAWRSRSPAERRYSPLDTSARIDESAERFEEVLEEIIRVAPLDRKMRRLAEEIRKTSRRVNALEQRLLPDLHEQVRFIRATLDQREREDVFRLKRLKNKHAR